MSRPDPATAYAVLTRDLFGTAREGAVVEGSTASIAALIDDGAARAASPAEVKAAAPYHFPLES